jgi:uncharacterized membrane protein YqjE
MQLDRMIRSLAEHLGSYLELGTLAAAEYRDFWLRRLILAAVVVVAGMWGLAIAWIAGLMALWDTAWRLPYVIGSAVLLLGAAGWSLGLLLARMQDGPSVSVFKSELSKDRELFEEWKRTH